MKNNVIPFPKLYLFQSEIDQEFIDLKKQKEKILKQKEEIDAKLGKK